ncbi:MAG: flagellar basal-body rod protein FlgF [bacterium]|nr:flagellar basal-body rod protein FlgF [bacterium]
MVKGLYSAYTGLLSEQKRLDIVSNNVANAATVGYKKEGVTNQAFGELLAIKTKDASVDQSIGSMSLGTKLGEVYTNYDQGSLQETGNTFDLAVSGNGFFQVAVADKNGNETTKYTRDGSFKLDSNGYILDSDGNHLIGENGYVQVPDTNGTIAIDASGAVYCNNVQVDTIELKDFEDYNYLKKYGNNLYDAVDGAEEKDASGNVLQGYLEQSNVQTVEEMVNMITITRAYETNQKVMNTMDSMLDKVVNQVGSI